MTTPDDNAITDANDARRAGLPLDPNDGEVIDLKKFRRPSAKANGRAEAQPESERTTASTASTPAPASNSEDRKTLVVTNDWRKTAIAAIDVLRNDPELNLYQRGGNLVFITSESFKTRLITMPPNAPHIRQVTRSVLGMHLTERLHLREERMTKEGPVLRDVHPQRWLLDLIMECREWSGIAPLAGVTEHSLLRPDGTLLTTPGYDAVTGLYFEPSTDVPSVPECPTIDDAIAALKQLESVVRDFPFLEPVHRSCWIAHILTLAARFAFQGPTPLFLYDASTRGSGKTLLALLAAIIAIGCDPFKTQFNSGDEPEIRKVITTLAIIGPRAILYDNLVGELGGASLNDLLTATWWNDRILSTNTSYSGPWLSVMSATGNNARLGVDMDRRVVHVRLEPKCEKPEERDDFEHSNILEWVRANQAQLLGAALTILRAYHVADRPSVKLRNWGSYEGWSAAVRAPLVWCGGEDVATARDGLASASSPVDVAAARFVRGLHSLTRTHGKVTAGRALKYVYPEVSPHMPDSMRDPYPELREAIEELLSVPDGRRPSARSVGQLLSRHRGRVLGGLSIQSSLLHGETLWSAIGTPTTSAPTEGFVE
jgi:hypothetical protein